MAGAIVPLMIAGTVLTAGAAVYSGIQASKQASTESAIAEANAQIIEEQGQQEADAHRREVAAALGEQAALYGAAGVVGGQGTPLLIQEETKRLGELDALTIERGAEAQAEIERIKGGYLSDLSDSYLVEGALTGASSLITGGARTWYLDRNKTT